MPSMIVASRYNWLRLCLRVQLYQHSGCCVHLFPSAHPVLYVAYKINKFTTFQRFISLNDTNFSKMISSSYSHFYKVDFYNTRHLACTEVRAAALSGDCDFWKEFWRFNIGLHKHHQVCVKRRASLSLFSTLNITKERADAVVLDVFSTCYSDTSVRVSTVSTMNTIPKLYFFM